MAKELERAGIPTVLVTCLTNVAEMVGANRILAGVAIPHPVGDPGLTVEEEHRERRRLILRALEALTVPVDIVPAARPVPIPPNITVISAGASNQIASWEEDRAHSLFTKYFLKAVSGEADRPPYGNGDGAVDWQEVRAYLNETVTYHARRYYGRDQTPEVSVGK